jgi:hypothetical protein
MQVTNVPTCFIAAAAVAAASATGTAIARPTSAHAQDFNVFGEVRGVMIVGSDNGVAVARKVAPFAMLRLEDSVDVTAHPGPKPGVIVHADDNIVSLIDTSVVGDALIVRVHKGTGFRTHRKVWVEVEFATLHATQQQGVGDLRVTEVVGSNLESSIAGSGDLQIDDVQLDAFTGSITGCGDLKIACHANGARFKIDGAGEVSAEGLVAKRVNVAIDGAGDAHVNATDFLDASVAGEGDVTYNGKPHNISRRVAGNGTIEAR